jgi:hypothetical protein
MQNEQKETKLFNVIMCYMSRRSLLIRSKAAKRFHSLMTCAIRDERRADAAKDNECDDRRRSLKTAFVDACQIMFELSSKTIKTCFMCFEIFSRSKKRSHILRMHIRRSLNLTFDKWKKSNETSFNVSTLSLDQFNTVCYLNDDNEAMKRI